MAGRLAGSSWSVGTDRPRRACRAGGGRMPRSRQCACAQVVPRASARCQSHHQARARAAYAWRRRWRALSPCSPHTRTHHKHTHGMCMSMSMCMSMCMCMCMCMRVRSSQAAHLPELTVVPTMTSSPGEKAKFPMSRSVRLPSCAVLRSLPHSLPGMVSPGGVGLQAMHVDMGLQPGCRGSQGVESVVMRGLTVQCELSARRDVE